MDKYISLTTIVGRVSELNPSYAIQSWLRDYASLEFLMLWESKYNPNFDKKAYEDLIQKIKDNEITTLTVKQWIESAKAVGITSKQGRNGGTYAQQAIACEFMMWLSPRYRFMMVETFLLTDKGGEFL